jgi:hypothetical protein
VQINVQNFFEMTPEEQRLHIKNRHPEMLYPPETPVTDTSLPNIHAIDHAARPIALAEHTHPSISGMNPRVRDVLARIGSKWRVAAGRPRGGHTPRRTRAREREGASLGTHAQYMGDPAIPPCPDCGAAQEHATTAPSRVVHEETCPLWRGVLAARSAGCFRVRRMPWMQNRIRPLTDAERADASWRGAQTTGEAGSE